MPLSHVPYADEIFIYECVSVMKIKTTTNQATKTQQTKAKKKISRTSPRQLLIKIFFLYARVAYMRAFQKRKTHKKLPSILLFSFTKKNVKSLHIFIY
jgi:hypothetical protein